jgi:hypothetical protein
VGRGDIIQTQTGFENLWKCTQLEFDQPNIVILSAIDSSEYQIARYKQF